MNRTLKKRLQHIEQRFEKAVTSRLPLLKPIVRIAHSPEDAARQRAELKASGALVSPDGREIPLLMYVVVKAPPR